MKPSKPNPAEMVPDEVADQHRAESVIKANEYVNTAPAGEPINPDAITNDPTDAEIERQVRRDE